MATPSRFASTLDSFVRAAGTPFSIPLALFGAVVAAMLAVRRR